VRDGPIRTDPPARVNACEPDALLISGAARKLHNTRKKPVRNEERALRARLHQTQTNGEQLKLITVNLANLTAGAG